MTSQWMQPDPSHTLWQYKSTIENPAILDCITVLERDWFVVECCKDGTATPCLWNVWVKNPLKIVINGGAWFGVISQPASLPTLHTFERTMRLIDFGNSLLIFPLRPNLIFNPVRNCNG